MNDNILSVNVPNIISVLLIAAVGGLILIAARKLAAQGGIRLPLGAGPGNSTMGAA
jgi:hypothetical protein